jgi:hypothetical protein
MKVVVSWKIAVHDDIVRVVRLERWSLDQWEHFGKESMVDTGVVGVASYEVNSGSDFRVASLDFVGTEPWGALPYSTVLGVAAAPVAGTSDMDTHYHLSHSLRNEENAAGVEEGEIIQEEVAYHTSGSKLLLYLDRLGKPDAPDMAQGYLGVVVVVVQRIAAFVPLCVVVVHVLPAELVSQQPGTALFVVVDAVVPLVAASAASIYVSHGTEVVAD